MNPVIFAGKSVNTEKGKKMYLPLNEKQQSWADSVFSSLTMEEKVLQLIHPNDRNWTAEEWIELLEKYPIGSFFCNTRNLAEMKKINA